MPLDFYKIFHILGVLMTFMALGAAIPGNSSSGPINRRTITMNHGIGLVLILIAGFGMLARLGVGFPTWVIIKIVLWLALGGMIVLVRRMPGKGSTLWYLALIFGALAAYMGIYKPF